MSAVAGSHHIISHTYDYPLRLQVVALCGGQTKNARGILVRPAISFTRVVHQVMGGLAAQCYVIGSGCGGPSSIMPASAECHIIDAQ